MSEINSICIRHYRVPLIRPYKLSFTSLYDIDSYVVKIISDNGKQGLGEVVPLDGYFKENADSVLGNILKISKEVVSLDMLAARECVQSTMTTSVMACSPLLSAIEMLNDEYPQEDMSIPLVGVMSTEDENPLLQYKMLSDFGYEVIKIKIGKNPKNDIQQSLQIFEIVEPGQKIRFDANQAYDLESALLFMEAIKSYKSIVEYVEQPLGIDAWTEFEELINRSDVPIMLDESINDENDIEHAAKIGASHIKLKLFKHGGVNDTGNLAVFAKKQGMKVILGNGVSTDIGNLAEGCVYNLFRDQFEETTEANGFVKCAYPLTNKPPALRGHSLTWTYSDSLELIDNNVVKEWVF